MRENKNRLISHETLRPVTRLYVLEAMLASGIIEPGLGILDSYLKARADVCFNQARVEPSKKRIWRHTGRYIQKILDGSIEGKKGFCRLMIGETSARRKDAFETARLSEYPPQKYFFASEARLANRLAIAWINIRTHLESPPPPNMRISLLELLITGGRPR